MTVKSDEKLTGLDVKTSDVPAGFQIDAQKNDMGYLIDGQLKKWSGAFQDVYSPIQSSDGGQLAPFKVGRFPLLTQEEALTALEAACKALPTATQRGALRAHMMKNTIGKGEKYRLRIVYYGRHEAQNNITKRGSV